MAQVCSISVNHRHAGIEGIERARFRDPDVAMLRLLSLPGVSEAVVLQTCNRVEIYAVAESVEDIVGFARAEGMPLEIAEVRAGDDCLKGLLRLACGLESMIVGEDQILGQLKTALLQARRLGTIGPVLSTAIQKSIHVGARARIETEINKGSVSIGSAAVELAESLLGDLRGRTILVVGAGEMGTLVANAMAEKSLRAIYVANRTFEQAEKLASSLQGVAIRLERLCDYMGSADVVICATGAPHLIITKKMVEQCKGEKPLIFIDITNPRNIEETVGEVPGVTLHNIDSLRQINEASMRRRQGEARKVEAIIEEELVLLQRDIRRLHADRVIGDLYQRTDHIRATELRRAVARLSTAGSLTEQQISILHDFSMALTNKILAAPTRQLRRAAERCDEDCLRTAEELFDLWVEESNGIPGNKTKASKTD
ncbi:glutamyl-tRNA reductase [Methanocella arvoryzae]|uniref:Glutamyl-tRNA reductase n=1 Tax=Methanocella arvoryzae (strain DSM 22066 / NBRC 105507 / MRE50) TaxID=351160 RepID=HEM1_METAR|nr:glutamyl-tRNA reductase [Methanocella arvoryzae]Q0W5T5.1 RecName: Full=Glutamyl-tRNA reductase; Short=GluTR [Methanocella arvoryzae MRE50]CAJ36258.1 glutamyl-tRNA reductase [Methanocella arvoryzae MRE50]